MRWTGTAVSNQTAAIIIAVTLLHAVFCGQAFAQSSGDNGVSNFLGNIFSGQKSATSPQAQAAPAAHAPRHPRRCPGAAKTAVRAIL